MQYLEAVVINLKREKKHCFKTFQTFKTSTLNDDWQLFHMWAEEGEGMVGGETNNFSLNLYSFQSFPTPPPKKG